MLIKKIKYKIVKFLYNYFKKIYIRNINIDDNEILQYAHNELTIYVYNKDSKYYNDIIEVIAAISKNNNINSSIKHNISVINKLCDKVPITPLTLKEDEFEQSISSKILYVNKRYNRIYKYLNKMFVTNAFSISISYILSTKTKRIIPYSTDLSWKSNVFETKNGILTGRYFDICYLQQRDIINGWTPKPTRNIDCVEIEIAPDNWIMAVDTNDIDLIYLSLDYYIQWENCFCMKDIRLEDVTPELEKKLLKKLKIINNK